MLGRRPRHVPLRPVAAASVSVLVGLLVIGIPSAGLGHGGAPGASAGVVPFQSAPRVKLEFVAQGCPLKELWDVTLFTSKAVNVGTKSALGGGPLPRHVVFTVVPGNYTFSTSSPPNFAVFPLPPYTLGVNVSGKLTVVDLICAPVTTSMPLNGTAVFSSNPFVGKTLNNTTARPWGEAYDPVNGCLYVTEDPTTPATVGFVTVIGPTNTSLPISFPTGVAPGEGFNPLGLAWAPSYPGAPVAYPGGFLLVADSQSNGLSLFGMTDPNNASFCWPDLLGTVDTYVYAPNGLGPTSLASPYDVVFGRQTGASAVKLGAAPGLFYVSWQNGYVAAFAGLSEGRVVAGLTDPLGLSYGGPNGYSAGPNGYLEIPNFAPNGWVTSYRIAPTDIGPAGAPALGAVSNSAKTLDEPVWTAIAPRLQLEPNASKVVREVVATSDSSMGVNGNLQGGGGTSFGDVPGCALGSPPLGGVMGELAYPTALGCVNAVGTTDQPVPALAPLSFGNTWAASTEDVYQVAPYYPTDPLASFPGFVESVTSTQVACGAACTTSWGAGVGFGPIEVIWASNALGTVGVDFIGLGSASTGTLIVTAYGEGVVSFLPAFYLD